MTPRIQKAIDIFLDAVNNGTLGKGSCLMCAVGNLVANGIGFDIAKFTNRREIAPNRHWGQVFHTPYGHSQTINYNNYKGLPKENIDSTDFNLKELALIEETFERNTKIHSNDYKFHSKKEIRKDQINGLKAVVEVMLTFDDQHDNINEVFTTKAKLISL